ncbi:hypothetical protein SI65_04233 [Aspergillus cristatus]|uniref:Uncharacterized protein n=1 Tax=Aspergillus cristatus TaxID=573508 RepID=A0A1E3BJP1_ASPCR|nr:hypothetical protein SI65_04233 [Aspergillus cristatus]
MTTTNPSSQNSTHTGGFGELCSASEHISYLQAGNTSPSLLSADGRKRSNRGFSDDEDLAWDGLVNEDWRTGGPHLCTIPVNWQDIPKEHPLYSRLVPGRDLTLKISAILRRSKVATEIYLFLHTSVDTRPRGRAYPHGTYRGQETGYQ